MAARRRAADKAETIEIAGSRLSHPDRVLFPGQGVTKRDLAAYYAEVAPRMLPHVAGRPLTLVRCPQGRQKACFYQRHAGPGMPKAIDAITIAGIGRSDRFLSLHDASGLVALVQIGVLEIHPWNARADMPERPDRMIFDLDPGEGTDFAAVAAATHGLRARLDALHLRSFVKTTGGKGLHVVVPLGRRHGWDAVKGFSRRVAEAMAAEAPDAFTTNVAKEARRGRIYVDVLRNDAAASAIAPYSTRARTGAPVALPLHWDELTPDLVPARFTPAAVLARLSAPDPWAEMAHLEQGLPDAGA
jgi:bifunctional non-homologous end joining protein LigD